MKMFAGSKVRFMAAAAVAALYLVPGTAYACPPGFEPNAAGTPGRECIPSAGQGGGEGGDYSQSSGPFWETRWGAFAYDYATAIVGVGSKMPSRGKAKKAAVADCQSRGGKNCKVEFSYYNHCAAIAEGRMSSGLYTRYYRSENGLDDAVSGALKGCADQGGAACQAIITDCSRPQRVR